MKVEEVERIVIDILYELAREGNLSEPICDELLTGSTHIADLTLDSLDRVTLFAVLADRFNIDPDDDTLMHTDDLSHVSAVIAAMIQGPQ